MSENSNYIGLLLEEIRDQNKAILEAFARMRIKVSKLPTREEFTGLKQDVKTIKTAVTDVSRQQQDHERRITRLESAA